MTKDRGLLEVESSVHAGHATVVKGASAPCTLKAEILKDKICALNVLGGLNKESTVGVSVGPGSMEIQVYLARLVWTVSSDVFLRKNKGSKSRLLLFRNALLVVCW